jgi:hypothetical protein
VNLMIMGLAAATAVSAQAPATTNSYLYEAAELVNGQVTTAYRVSFELRKGRDGTLEAVVRKAETSDHGGPWSSPDISDSCRTAMHAPEGAIAKVQIWPVRTGADPLGAAFLDLCAPGPVFFPLTDIVNVALIPLSPQFQGDALRKAGDTARFPAFTARFERNGRQFEEHVTGGVVSLASRSANDAVVDWRPDPADLSIREPSPQGPTQFHGAEHWSFRISYDPKTQELHWARTTYDDIEMAVVTPGIAAEAAPHVKITRQVRISEQSSGQ